MVSFEFSQSSQVEHLKCVLSLHLLVREAHLGFLPISSSSFSHEQTIKVTIDAKIHFIPSKEFKPYKVTVQFFVRRSDG